MTNYARMYRFGITPWERYRTAAAASIAALLDREEAGRSRPLGRALDLGCGRGLYTPELARRGWEAVRIDYVPPLGDWSTYDCPKCGTYSVSGLTEQLIENGADPTGGRIVQRGEHRFLAI